MKNISRGDHRHCRRLRLSVGREKARIAGTSLNYKLIEPIDLGKNDRMFSRLFIRSSGGIQIASTRDFAQSRVFTAACNYHSAKRYSKDKQEAS